MILNALLASIEPNLRVQVLQDSQGFNWAAAMPWFVALASLGFGYYQYWFNHRIKRLEYLDALAKRPDDDPLLRSAFEILDWDARLIKIRRKKFAYHVFMLPGALRTELDDPEFTGFQSDEVAIREAFDALFNFFEHFCYAVDLGVLSLDDVAAFPPSYYLCRLLDKDAWLGGCITRYLRGYGFQKTAVLMRWYASHPSCQRRELTPAYREKIMRNYEIICDLLNRPKTSIAKSGKPVTEAGT